MPIRPENRGRYPANWPEISLRIRFERAEGRCECDGRCGEEHPGGRCDARHGLPHPVTKSRVVLTTAHVHGTTPEQCEDEHLFAACQRCHNKYDAPMRAKGIKDRKEAERAKVLAVAGSIAFSVECSTGRKVAR